MTPVETLHVHSSDHLLVLHEELKARTWFEPIVRLGNMQGPQAQGTLVRLVALAGPLKVTLGCIIIFYWVN